jgi:hypothetical protein
MGEESVKGANLGVILIIFASILALGLIVFMLARNMANTGLTNVSEKLQAAEESEFTDFDGSTVVGQRVHAALAGFKGKKVAVLIATQGFTDKLAQAYMSDAIPAAWVGTGTTTTDDSGTSVTSVTLPNLKGSGGLLLDTANITGRENMKLAYAVGPDGETPMKTSTSSNVAKVTTFIQYNALLEPTNNKGNVAEGVEGGHTVIKFDNGTYIFDGAYRTDDGKVVFDLDYANLSKTGMTEMVPGAARFHANLLKDANGVILGVVFQQVGN